MQAGTDSRTAVQTAGRLCRWQDRGSIPSARSRHYAAPEQSFSPGTQSRALVVHSCVLGGVDAYIAQTKL